MFWKKMKEEKFEYPIPIDSGSGLPLVLAVTIGLFAGFVSIVYGAWLSKDIKVQTVTAICFLYIVTLISYRFIETKQHLPVPAFKGWDKHNEDVDKVVSEFQEFLKHRLPGEKASINRFKKGPHESNRVVETKYKETSFKINTSSLDQVIALDKEKNILHVEPGIPMDELALIAIAHGYIPQMVPEFPGITVGGAIGGAAGESTGHRYGVFHNTVESMDVITGDGILHKDVSRTHKSDLFMAVCCSYGTQGVLVRASIRVMPAPNYIRLQYYHEDSIDKGLDRLEMLANDAHPPEFLDAVALTPSSVIVVAGYPADAIPEGSSQLHLRNSRTDPWFFWYLTDLAKEHEPALSSIHTDYIELDDYLFRFDKGAFWGGRHGMMLLHGSSSFSSEKDTVTGPHPFLRFIWSWLGTTRQIYKLCHAAGDVRLAEFYIVQDLFMPTKQAASSLIKFNQNKDYNIWPLWICPFRKTEENHEKEVGLGFPLTGKVGDLMYNVGIYGLVNSGKPMNPVEKNRALEKEVARLGGKKIFYAQSFYTPEEFWSNFKKEYYDELRKQYNNEDAFHEITTKVLLSEKTKQAICKECGINLIGNFHKLIPYFGQMILEHTLPSFLYSYFGITHYEMKRYIKIE
jgi:FAD/FMN-containing dehydrogenase